MQITTAKLFPNGGSQAVRLPAEFRFPDATEIYIRRDESTGDVVLSTRSPADWRSFMKLRDQLDVLPADFLAEREQSQQSRDPFEGWTE